MIEAKDANKMNEEQLKLIIQLKLIDPSNLRKGNLEEVTEGCFLNKIVHTRIEVLDLPITLALDAWLAVSIFADRPGSAVLLLIDCLEFLDTLEGERTEITLDDLCKEIYPFGFYNEEALGKRIDAIKDKNYTSEWCKIY